MIYYFRVSRANAFCFANSKGIEKNFVKTIVSDALKTIGPVYPTGPIVNNRP